MKLFSPAKINLFLQVLRRREDGYHDLASLFQAISLGDTLTFTPANHDLFTCTVPYLPSDSSNLVIKALHLFRKKTGLYTSLHLHLEKKTPLQAGLGGGSSNAATTLWGLNELHQRPVSENTLREWGAELGSDVSFFFSSGTAYCTGRGEQVQSLAPLPFSKSIWLCKPPEGLSTPAIFRMLDLKTCLKQDPLFLLNQWQQGVPYLHNDLETPAFAVLPSLRAFKSDLIESGLNDVTMTGSGTGFFGFGSLEKKIKEGISYPITFLNRKEYRWY